jgi:spermidine synthase
MVFISGFASLVYQILWMRQIGLLFGNTSQAAAITLGAFFTGLTIGSWVLGKRSIKSKNPLRTYAYLEGAVAMTALLYFAIHNLFYSLYPSLYQSVDSSSLLFLFKILLSLMLVFPPAFCMGGTVPVIGQFLVSNRNLFGRVSALLFSFNTIGAACGAFFTAFYLVPLFGFQNTCIGAIFLSLSVAIISFYLSRGVSFKTSSVEKEMNNNILHNETNKSSQNPKNHKPNSLLKIEKLTLLIICFVSGFSVLALEVIWTRMFAQVHENSVYSLSVVLVVVLISLGIGSMISSILAKKTEKSMIILTVLMLLSGIAVMFCPFLFMYVTDGLSTMSTAGTFYEFMTTLFKHGFISIGLVAAILGTVFPFLMRIEESFLKHPGMSLGKLSAINTFGAIIGSLACGFVFLEKFGMWQTLQFISALYLLISLLMSFIWNKKGYFFKAIPALSLILLFTKFSPVDLPLIGAYPSRANEKIVEIWEASDTTVAVVDTHDGHRKLRINSNYSLGSTSGLLQQVFQTRIPLLAFPKTETIFYLGMGTGSTAGSSLNKAFGLKKVVVCELSPNVVQAAQKHMSNFQERDFTFGLFTDPRAKVLVEDGRQHLMITEEKYDMINADLFLPYRSGAGSLYSYEHFMASKERLNQGGVFVQWLPLYQITKNELGIIAKTMLKAFPMVTMWRNNFQPNGEIIALVGHRDTTPLHKTLLNSTADKRNCVSGKTVYDISNIQIIMNEQTALVYYCGNLSEARVLFKEYPINTDDRPLIEYMSPKSLRIWTDGIPPPFTSKRLSSLIDKILKISPLDSDPLLINRSKEDRRLPLAGAAFHKAHINAQMGDMKKLREAWTTFLLNWTNR